jgi:hypothetical protein
VIFLFSRSLISPRFFRRRGGLLWDQKMKTRDETERNEANRSQTLESQ